MVPCMFASRALECPVAFGESAQHSEAAQEREAGLPTARGQDLGGQRGSE